MTITYQNRIVAFIDVLGFSDLVYSKDTALITKYFDYVLEDSVAYIKKFKFNYHLISDSIVITTLAHRENLKSLLLFLSSLQSKLLFEGILVRGAISSGDIYSNKKMNILVGPGLINAYKLESKSIYPRVILDRNLINEFSEGTSDALSFFAINDYTPLLCITPQPYIPDFLFINYVYINLRGYSWIQYQIFIDLFRKYYFKNEHIEKYQWFKNYIYCQAIERQSQLDNLQKDTTRLRVRKRHLQRFIEELNKL